MEGTPTESLKGFATLNVEKQGVKQMLHEEEPEEPSEPEETEEEEPYPEE